MAFLQDLTNRFYISFIYEERWRFFLDGFWMTLLLTLSSFLLGTLLGALLCWLKTSKYGAVKKTVNLLIAFFMQIPTLVLLMVFVYIIFGSASLSAVVIVIIGLTIKAACYMADIFYTAVMAVDSGEAEAAQTLGLSRLQTFRYLTLPQSVAAALPVYKNQFIITLQETSIVGYVAIMDLTRATDIVTARTLDAMFGLITISLLYLLIGWIATSLLGLLGHTRHLGGEAE